MLRWTKKRRWVLAVVAMAAIVGVGGPAIASDTGPSVSIETVEESADRAQITVEGSSVSSPGPVVDAGSSPRVLTGQDAPLVAAAAYGTPPYSFEWSGGAGTFSDATKASTSYRTAGLPAGDQVLTVRVTDSSSRVATDTVIVRVDELVTTTTSTVVTSSGGHAAGAPEAAIDVPFAVPAGATRVALTLSFDATSCVPAPELGTTCAVDWDLKVSDPARAHEADTSGATSSNPEKLDYTTELAEGGWTAHAIPYTVPPGGKATVTVAVTAPSQVDFPVLPTIPPYSFTSGEAQRLSATVVGGQAPVSVAWDLDGDTVYERAGATVTADYAVGTNLATVKATDAHGYEAKQIVPVRVAAPGATPDTAGVVVIAVADSGLNLYHKDFRATTYPDPKVLALTGGFTKHPSTYIPDYPAGTPSLDLTLGEAYYPAADQPKITSIPLKTLHWVPGTKVIGVYDTGAGSGATGGADTIPILDENGHGTASTSVAAGNIYGFCPTCLIMFSEGLDETFNLEQRWVDISSNSFGALGNIGFAGLISPSIPKARAEAGLLTLYAAGNGNENAFVTPQQTYTNENLGPAWAIRVGAVERGSRKPIIGTGKPVDLSSFGSGTIPAAGKDSTGGTTNHSGTSAATPYTAGVFGNVLRDVRVNLGDTGAGQGRFAEAGAIAGGRKVASSPYLFDGRLTAAEIREAVFKTTQHDSGAATSVYPTTTPANAHQYAVEGYGIAEPASGARALDVLFGRAALPTRTAEDAFFAYDTSVRNELWGTWDGGGANSRTAPGAPAPSAGSNPLAGVPFGAAITSPADGAVLDPTQTAAVGVSGPVVFPAPGTSVPQRLYFRRDACGGTTPNNPRLETSDGPDGGTGCGLLASAATSQVFPNVYPLSQGALPVVLGTGNLVGDLTFTSQSVQGNTAPDVLTIRLDVSATVDGTSVRIASQSVRGTLVPPAKTVTLHYDTPLASSVAGKAVTALSATLTTETSTSNSFFVLDNPASSFDVPVVAPGVLASRSVELTVDGGAPVAATLNAARTGFVTTLDVSSLADGPHTLSVRALQDTQASPVRSVGVTVRRSMADIDGVALQIVPSGAEPTPGSWVQAADLGGGFARYRGVLPVAELAEGSYDVIARLRIAGEDVAFDRFAYTRAADPPPVVPEAPLAVLVPFLALLGGAVLVVARRRRAHW